MRAAMQDFLVIGSLHPLTYVSAVWTEYDDIEMGRNEEVMVLRLNEDRLRSDVGSLGALLS